MRVKPKHDHIMAYPWVWAGRFMGCMEIIWKDQCCKTCGTKHRDIRHESTRELMVALKINPTKDGPIFYENYYDNYLGVEYRCHGCQNHTNIIARWNDPLYYTGVYQLLKQYNPEYLEEFFTGWEIRKLTISRKWNALVTKGKNILAKGVGVILKSKK